MIRGLDDKTEDLYVLRRSSVGFGQMNKGCIATTMMSTSMFSMCCSPRPNGELRRRMNMRICCSPENNGGPRSRRMVVKAPLTAVDEAARIGKSTKLK